MGKWHKTRRFSMESNDSSLNIAPAAVQGLEANIKKWNAPRMKRIRNPNLRPFVVVGQIPRRLDASLQASEAVPEASRSRGHTTMLRQATPSSIPPCSTQQDDGYRHAPNTLMDATTQAQDCLDRLAAIGISVRSQTTPQCSMQNLAPQPDQFSQQTLSNSMLPPPGIQAPQMASQVSANHAASPMFDAYGDVLHAPGVWPVGGACSHLQSQSEPSHGSAPQASNAALRSLLSTRPPCPPPQMPAPGCSSWLPPSLDVGESAPIQRAPPMNPPGNWSMVANHKMSVSTDLPSSHLQNFQDLQTPAGLLERSYNLRSYGDLQYQ